MAGKRHNIGLLVAAITDDFSRRITIGAMEAAKEQDVNLVVFPGKYVGVQQINEQFEAEYDYQYNALFDIAAEAKLDYLIVAVGTIAYAHNTDYQKSFLNGLGDTPILSVASEIDGYDFLGYDDSTGIREAVDYLAAQGRKHIGMIAGDLHNDTFVRRYEAYREALEANGLVFREGYMTPCSLAFRCYDEAGKLLDGHPELDAIICSTDLIAFDVYHELEKRGLRPGTDVAVVGFDDLPAARLSSPPLASVRADAVQLGRRAVEKVANILRGVPDDCRRMASRFIPRRSCFKYVGDLNISDEIATNDFDSMISHVRDYMAQRSEEPLMDGEAGARVVRLLEHLRDNYVARPVEERDIETTIAMLDQVMPLKADMGIDGIFYGAYVWLMRNCPAGNLPYVQMLHRYFRSNREEETAEALIKRHEERTHTANNFIRDALMFASNLKDSYARILKKLDSVGAVTAFIYRFQEPINHSYGDLFPADLSWFFESYSFGRDTFTVPEDERAMPTPRVFDNDHLCTNRQHIFIVADLFSAETQYGVALLEPRDESFLDELELVTYQLSSAVRTLDILKRQERLVRELHATNKSLEELSRKDELTGVYNRKGFFPAAEALVRKYQGQTLMVCYGDMDDLRGINEIYGRAEGDFALRLAAECMAYTLGDLAVIGRVGSDEFAAVVPVPSHVVPETLKERKEHFLRRFNESGEKPYRVGMKMGLYGCMCFDGKELAESLKRADALLSAEIRKQQGK